MASPRVIVVTGANRGIGSAICKLILSKPELTPLVLYATSRKGEDLGFASSGKGQQLQYPKLDISQSSSIHAFADKLEQSGNPVDVLINNAGVNLDNEFSPENAKKTLDVNYRGTLEMTRAFLPLMRPKTGRIVSLSSVASSLKPYSPQLAQTFRSISNLADLDAFAQQYEKAVANGTDASAGWPSQRSYTVSKGCVNSLTKILANGNPDVVINCCCPGWVDSDMGGLVGTQTMRPPKTLEEGARIPVRLAFGDIDGVSGRYWANDSIRGKGEGEVQEW